MIKRSNDRVWIKFPENDNFYLMGEGFSHLEEVCKTVFLETPRIGSTLCAQEILYHVAYLEFEGYRDFSSSVHDLLYRRYMTRGKDAEVTLIIGNQEDNMTAGSTAARRVKGQVCLENPGTGEGPLGSFFKGTVRFTSQPEKGLYIIDEQAFFPSP
ncbi:MAG: hypothetical protein J6M34_03945 [Clostridia bacterium]|nr:hypothetical protein [Clostridia bacterium]